MSPYVHRLAPTAAVLLAIPAATLTAASAQAQDMDMPHAIHAFEGWVALAVVVLSLVGAGLLIRRAVRR